jgi:hypothetical protein
MLQHRQRQQMIIINGISPGSLGVLMSKNYPQRNTRGQMMIFNFCSQEAVGRGASYDFTLEPKPITDREPRGPLNPDWNATDVSFTLGHS